jgi:hypothetical protein
MVNYQQHQPNGIPDTVKRPVSLQSKHPNKLKQRHSDGEKKARNQKPSGQSGGLTNSCPSQGTQPNEGKAGINVICRHFDGMEQMRQKVCEPSLQACQKLVNDHSQPNTEVTRQLMLQMQLDSVNFEQNPRTCDHSRRPEEPLNHQEHRNKRVPRTQHRTQHLHFNYANAC